MKKISIYWLFILLTTCNILAFQAPTRRQAPNSVETQSTAPTRQSPTAGTPSMSSPAAEELYKKYYAEKNQDKKYELAKEFLSRFPNEDPYWKKGPQSLIERYIQREPSRQMLPAGTTTLSDLQDKGLTLYTLSSEPRSWCGPTVEMIITTRDNSGFEKYPDALRYLLKEAWGKSQFYCKGQTKRINVKMLAEGREVRRGWLGVDMFHEEFTESQSPNPAKEKLATIGLAYQPIIENLFYGRFDRVLEEDSAKVIFARIYQSFLREYGNRHGAFLQRPIMTILRTVESTDRFGNVTSKETVFKIEERFDPSLSENLNKWGLGSAILVGLIPMIKIDADMLELVSRHQGDSPALRQFLENLYRYANNEPSVQRKPAKLTATQENKK